MEGGGGGGEQIRIKKTNVATPHYIWLHIWADRMRKHILKVPMFLETEICLWVNVIVLYSPAGLIRSKATYYFMQSDINT